MLQLLTFVIVLALWSASVFAANLSPGKSCTTPGGNHGRCILENQCPLVYKLSQNAKSRKDRKYATSFKCGQESRTKKLLVCCPELRSAEPCGQLSMHDRIHGGNETELDEFLWTAALSFKKGKVSWFGCAGSLINDRYVLTAAHCVNGDKRLRLNFVRLGEWDMRTNPDCKYDEYNGWECNEPHQDFGVTKIIVHERYSDSSLENDIAILKLNRRTTFAPVCIPTRTMLSKLNIERTKFDVTGWGLTEKIILSKRKLKVEIPGQPMSACLKLFQKKYIFENSQICAGGEKGKDSCRGDSGGPLMLVQNNRWHLMGIVSFGTVDCGIKNEPSIYTRVGSYLHWVAGKLELESRYR